MRVTLGYGEAKEETESFEREECSSYSDIVCSFQKENEIVNYFFPPCVWFLFSLYFSFLVCGSLLPYRNGYRLYYFRLYRSSYYCGRYRIFLGYS